MIEKTISITKCKVLIYFNSDILFHKNIIVLITSLLINSNILYKRILIVGKRGDIFWKKVYKYRKLDLLWEKCKLHPGTGIDYFIFTKSAFSISDIEILNKIVVGRVRYDNIILSLALKEKNNFVFDATEYVKAIHLSLSNKEKEELTKVYL